ncbi:group 1 glycosyl transferase, partial [Klebsiella pneumoniae]
TELSRILPNIYFLEDIQDIDSIPFPVEIDDSEKKIFNVDYVTEQYLKIYKG